MIVYMDGSSVANGTSKEHWVLSWGMVVHHNDSTTEHYGILSGITKQFLGFHEMLAFAEAVRYVRKTGVPFEDVLFITDDEWVVNAQFVLHPDNWCDTEAIHNRLMMFVNEFFPCTVYDDMVEALKKARFIKVKGHESTVYNLRVDYLASHARKEHHGLHDDFLNFEQWLSRGFKFFNTKKKLYDVWYAPFASLAV